MAFPAGVKPIEALAQRKRYAADRCDVRAARLRAEADAMLKRGRAVAAHERSRPQEDTDRK